VSFRSDNDMHCVHDVAILIYIKLNTFNVRYTGRKGTNQFCDWIKSIEI